MSHKKIKKEKEDRPKSPWIFSSMVRYLLALPSTSLDIQMLGGTIVLLIIVLAEKLISRDALIFVVIILGYLLLRYLARRSDKNDEK